MVERATPEPRSEGEADGHDGGIPTDRPSTVIETIGPDQLARHDRTLLRLDQPQREAVVARLERAESWVQVGTILGVSTVDEARSEVSLALRRLGGEAEPAPERTRLTALAEAVADRSPVQWQQELDHAVDERERQIFEQLQLADAVADACWKATDSPRRLGDFEILRELGRGGMGVVYEARQLSLNRRVALKVLPPALGFSSQATQRFEREARAAAKLHHTNIVPVHAISHEQGHHFYAMDLIEGDSLDRILTKLADPETQARGESTPMARESSSASLSDTAPGGREWFDMVAKLVAEVADALHYAHGRGIIHRDIKPANLMLSREGRLCITDFGLARMLEEPGLTVSGSFLGTPAYMSPEQIAAGRVKLDHRTDIYSLGTVLYELLTLQRPFNGQSREEVLSAVLSKDPRRPRRHDSKVPLDLETVCLKAMEKDPDRRYRSAAEFAADLRQYLNHGLITARRAGPIRRLGKFVRRHSLATTGAAAAVLVVGLVAFSWWALASREQEAVLRSIADARYFLAQGDYRKGLDSIELATERAPGNRSGRVVRARLLMMLDRHAEAADEAKQLLEEDPRDWTAHLILGVAARTLPGIAGAEHLSAVEEYATDKTEAYYLSAMMAESKHDAIELLNRALENNPGHVGALLERAQRYIDARDFQAALHDAERVAALRPNSAQGRRMIAWTYYNLYDFERALSEYGKALELDPDDPITYLQRAWVHKAPEDPRMVGGDLPATGDLAAAVADLTRAIELDPGYAVFFGERAGAYYGLGRYADAVRDARRALGLRQDYLAAWSVLGYSQIMQGRMSEVEAIVGEIAAATEGWTDARAQAEARIILMAGYQALGQIDRAFTEVDRAIEAAPDYWQSYYARAWLRRRTGDSAGADEDCLRSAAIDLSDADDLLLRGAVLSADTCGRPDLAAVDLDKAIELAPRWAAVYHVRAHLREKRRQFSQSLEDFNRAIQLAPTWSDAVVCRGTLHSELEQYSEALADYDRAFDLGGDSSGPYLARAEVLLRLGRAEEAFQDFDRFIEIHPEHAAGYRARAAALFDSGRVEEALIDIDRAIEYAPGQYRNYVDRAFYLLHGPADCVGALENLSKAREVSPDTWIRVGTAISRVELAGLFYVCPEQFDAAEALSLASKAAQLSPDDPTTQALLGLALYRAGRFADARTVLTRSLDLEVHPQAGTLLTLAMTEWRLGHEADARSHHDRAVQRIRNDYPEKPELRRREEEVARLLGPG